MTTLFDYCKQNNKEYLLDEWDNELNLNFNIKTILTGSNKKIWWHCLRCHGRWQATVYDRTRVNNTGCPYCFGNKVLSGYNDLLTKYPAAAAQWHPTKNGSLTATEVKAGSSKVVWWICSKGHEFKQKINSRVKHLSSCPICSGQKVLIGYNDLLSQYPDVAQEWHYIKNRNMNPQNITCGSNKKVWWKCKICGYEWQARVVSRTKNNTGCAACSNKVLVVGNNDLASQFPELAKEWHPTKNGILSPNAVKAHSKKKVWWLCSHGHDFLQSIHLRTMRNHKCPFCCNQKILIGYNDLASQFPELAKEWHPTKNGILSPQNVSAGSKRKVWWVCSAGHEYEQAIEKRTTRNCGCPYCSGHKAWAGLNDFRTKFPEIAKEWHPTKNGALTPEDVTYGSGKKVWWKCPIGHEYQAVVRDRGIGHTKCPICNSRNATSFPEQALFYYVKHFYPDAINKYSEIFDTSMELDIYIPLLQTAIEYDGAAWHKSREHYQRERKKYEFCQKKGIFLIRIKECSPTKWNDVADEVFYLSKVKRCDLSELEKAIEWLLKILNIKDNINIDLNNDKYKILRYVYKIDNSLADKRPDIAAKWNYEKNDYLKPDMFSVGSNEIVWWKCPDCGNEWQCSINSMTRERRIGCFECSKKIVIVLNFVKNIYSFQC